MFPTIHLSWGSICFADPADIIGYCLQMDNLRRVEDCELAVATATAAAACPSTTSALSAALPFSSNLPVVIRPYLSITVVLYLATALFLLLARRWWDDELCRVCYARLSVYCYTVAVAGWEGGMVCATMICTQYGLWRLGAVVVLLFLSQRCLNEAANPWEIKFSLNKTLVIYHGIFC